MSSHTGVATLLPEHRDRAWRDKHGTVWSWSVDREMWLDEVRGEADRSAWRTQDYMDSHGRYTRGPFTAVSEEQT